MNKELRALEETAARYTDRAIAGWEGLYREKRRRLFQAFRPFCSGTRALELGVADGEMSRLIAAGFPQVTCVDGSTRHLAQARERIDEVAGADAAYVHSLFEDYEPASGFDAIFMAHILEHLEDPVAMLRRAAGWLAPGGRLLLAVPNSNSLHRHVGVKLGMIERLDALNEQDRIVGHRRVYGPGLFREHVRQAGLALVHFGGLMVKPLSNRQMESWPPELQEAFFAISDEFPELCSEIYIVAEPVAARSESERHA